MELKGRNERKGCLGTNGVERTVEKPCAAMRLWESVEKWCFSRAKAENRSMVACSIDHFRAIKEYLTKMTRSNCGQHGHGWRVKRVFELMAMAPNDGHFEMNEMVIFV